LGKFLVLTKRGTEEADMAKIVQIIVAPPGCGLEVLALDEQGELLVGRLVGGSTAPKVTWQKAEPEYK
jgi:hypothetical protein